jgi:predicted enzyme related to lactoylglutathione lyase
VEVPVRIRLSSIFVDDQDKAASFYTDAMGFVKRRDIPMGPARWLTVVSPEGPDDVELVLEPNTNPAARTFQQALKARGIPLTAFAVDDIHAEFARLRGRGVAFTMEPTAMGPVTLAVLDDTCGNLIQIYQA